MGPSPFVGRIIAHDSSAHHDCCLPFFRNIYRLPWFRLYWLAKPLIYFRSNKGELINRPGMNDMRTMIDLGSQRGNIRIMDTPTSVDCAREVRFRRSFRSLVECMVPCCGFQPSSLDDSPSTDSDASTVTGTFFGFRKGRVSFCIQDDTRSSPLLLLEFAVPTSYLAREMQHGLLRIALECDRKRERERSSSCSLFNVPVWSMYCNGRKVGFAVRRQMAVGDLAVLKLMQTVSVGAGVLPSQGDLMYLRARFDRVIGSADSESFHMINPVGTSGQQLGLFLLRS